MKNVLAGLTLVVATLGGFAPPAQACMSEVCEAVNRVCEKVTKGYDCLG
jgi:hypothetical protein